MEIGEPQRIIEVVPLQEPLAEPEQVPAAPEQEPVEQPDEVPA